MHNQHPSDLLPQLVYPLCFRKSFILFSKALSGHFHTLKSPLLFPIPLASRSHCSLGWAVPPHTPSPLSSPAAKDSFLQFLPIFSNCWWLDTGAGCSPSTGHGQMCLPLRGGPRGVASTDGAQHESPELQGIFSWPHERWRTQFVHVFSGASFRG